MDTTKIKKGLGRGLSSLIGETKIEININKISISDLVSNKFQPRKVFDEDSLKFDPSLLYLSSLSLLRMNSISAFSS